MPGAIPLEAVDDGDDVDSFIETPAMCSGKGVPIVYHRPLSCLQRIPLADVSVLSPAMTEVRLNLQSAIWRMPAICWVSTMSNKSPGRWSVVSRRWSAASRRWSAWPRLSRWVLAFVPGAEPAGLPVSSADHDRPRLASAWRPCSPAAASCALWSSRTARVWPIPLVVGGC